MEREVLELAKNPNFKDLAQPRIDILGAGLGRDLLWINQAMDADCYVKVYDMSHVACEGILSNFNYSKHKGYHLEVVQGEIKTHWNSDNVLIYYASQFIQVQKRPRMRSCMRHLGSLLKRSFSGFKPTLYLVHPFGKDNPDAQWGDTTPYSEEEMLDAMERKGRKEATVELLGVHSYFHQKYSLLKIRNKG